MKIKAAILSLSMAFSLLGVLLAVPIMTGAAASDSIAALDPVNTSSPAVPDVRDKKGDRDIKPDDKKRTQTSAVAPITHGPFTIEAAAGSFDGDLRDLPAVTFDEKSPARVMPEPLETFDLKAEAQSAITLPPDRDVQRSSGGANMPAPGANFAGNSYADNPVLVLPPDTIGDVGPRYYIQYVNFVFSIYDKATGTRVAEKTLLSSLFTTDQAPCNSDDDGDPIVLYDAMADRWLLTEFRQPNYPAGPFYQCIAVSKSGDPVAGGWWTYVFPVSTPDIDGDNMAFNDYAKLSVWPDAYYMTANMFPTQNTPVYVRIWALDRARMLAGRPVRSVFFDVFDTSNVLPGNLKGDAPPPGSSAFLLAAQPPDKLNFWTFHVDFENPSLSSLSGLTQLAVNPFAPACGGGACVPQAGTPVGLDTLSPRLMFGAQYRRVGNVESLWTNQTISNSNRAALRWYEVRLTRGGDAITPTLYQQSTYNPADGVWRWMGSMAADKDGNAAIGYSASSPSIFPQIRYAGRLASDPLNVLAQGEYTLWVGGGAQLRSDAPRWGDYSDMSVDPVDDCTFWYTNEYYEVTTQQNWSTRIGSFKYPSCTPLPAVGYITGTVYDAVTSAPLPYMPVAAMNAPLTRTFSAATDANGVFTMTVLPGTYSISGGPLSPIYPVAGSAGPIAVTSNNTATINVPMQPYPVLVEGNVTLVDAAPNGNGNGFPEPGESNLQLFESVNNIGTVTATNVTAQLIALSPGVTVVTPTASYGTLTPGALAVNGTPFGFSINGGVACGSVLNFMKVISSDQRVFTLTFSLNAQLPASQSPTYTYVSTDVPKAVPDNNPIGASSVITVPDTFSIAKAIASLTISHTFDSDLNISLINPAGTSIDLSSGNGSRDDNYVSTVFDDDAATSIVSGTAPFTGQFRPEQPLATFNKSDANGTWELHVADMVRVDVGTIATWTLKLKPAYCAYPVPNLKFIKATYNELGSTSNGIIEPGDNSIDVFAGLKNIGTFAATSVSATVVPEMPNVSMNVGNVTYPDINTGATITNSSPFNFALSPSFACGMPVRFQLNAHAARGDFSQRFSLPTGTDPISAKVQSDDVEHGQGSWITGTTYLGWSWRITNEDSNSPTQSWTDSPGAQYPIGASTWLASPVYDFSAYDDVTLSFWHKYDTEPNYDFGYVEYSIDGGATWAPDPLATYNGLQQTWTQATVDLAPLAHQPNTRFRFRLFSDPSIVGDGWHIDDIRVTGLKRICHPVSSDWQQLVYVNGVLTNTNPASPNPGDVVQVVDRLHLTSTRSITFALADNWTSALALNGYTSTIGLVATSPNSLTWNANNVPFNALQALTRTFTAQLGPASGTLVESLEIENGVPLYPDRTLLFNLPTAALVTSSNLLSTQETNRRVSQALTLSNTGAVLLTWNLFEFGPSQLAQPIELTAPTAITTSFNEGFDNITTLAGNGWLLVNRSSPPGSTGWFQGNPSFFAAQSGAPTAYIAADLNNTNLFGTISNWLMTPEILLKNGDRVAFYTRTRSNSLYADRLELRMSRAGPGTDVGVTADSVGAFTTTLLSINPNLLRGGYPEIWTAYTVTLSGLSAPTTGRVAFRYYVTNGGLDGANSNYIGIDTFKYIATLVPCSTVVDIPWLSVSPASGTINPDTSRALSVTFDSTGLPLGIYTSLLCINSNDPFRPTVQLPVTLHVVPHARIFLPIVRKNS